MNLHSDSKVQHPDISSIRAFDSVRFGCRLAAAVLALNLVVIGFGMFSLQNSREQYQRQAETQTQNLARAMDQVISHSVEKINLSLRTVVNEYQREMATGEIDQARIQAFINVQSKLLHQAISFRVFGVDGGAALGSEGVANHPANVADREYFTSLKASLGGGAVVSKPLLSRFDNKQVIVFAQRIENLDGSFAGIVAIPVQLEYFNSLLSKYDVGANGSLGLRDADLVLFVRRPEMSNAANIQLGSSKPSEALRKLVEAGLVEGSYSAIATLDNIERSFSFRKISNAPMYAFVGLAKTDYMAGWYRDLWKTLSFLVVFAFATTVSGVLIFRIWRRQVAGTRELEKSHHHLEGLMIELDEHDSALRATQEAGGIGTYNLNLANKLFASSRELDRIFGITPDYPHTLEGWESLIHPEDRQRMLDYFSNEVVGKQQVFNQKYRIIRPVDASTCWLHGYGTLDFDEAGNPIRMRGAILDVSERKQAEEQLRLAHEVFMNTQESIVITDKETHILDINPAFLAMTGYSREDVIGKSTRMFRSGYQNDLFYQKLWESLSGTGQWEGEFQNKRRNGHIYIQATKISAVRDDHDSIIRYIAVASDVTQLREHQNQIEHLAYHDRLTDLPNRVMLADRLQLGMAQAARRKELLGVCYIDLDGFKLVNDTWGHDIGDEVLIEVAERLSSNVRAGDTVARLGGDEFIVLLGNAKHVGEIEQAIRRMLAAIALPFQIGQTEAELTASIGVALYPDDVDDADMLIRRADQSMYRAKNAGKNQFHLFDSTADRRMRAEHDLALRIAMALESEELRLYYQPKVDMPSGRVIGAEALIRWQHPERGLLPPIEFLPVVEDTEFSISLGEWVITEALRQMAEWSAVGLILPVSVNISGYHLQRPDFVPRLARLLEAYSSVSPHWLQLEILETTAMEDVDMVSRIITECGELGVSFALDDFGTGYSSLTYFRRLPTNLLKIDRSFIFDMLNDPEDYALVEGIVKLAHSFQRQVIAEGVETITQGLALKRLGCDQAQGFGIARPMPAEDIPSWVRDWQMPDAWRESHASDSKP